jgi:hypothetical protein
MAEQTMRDAGSDRVAETVRRALLLVGPSENGVERVADESAVEEPAL